MILFVSSSHRRGAFHSQAQILVLYTKWSVGELLNPLLLRLSSASLGEILSRVPAKPAFVDLQKDAKGKTFELNKNPIV